MNTEHQEVVLAHEEKFKNIEERLGKLEESSNDIIDLAKQLVGMRVELANAIQQTTSHINAGSKYRLTIILACLGLVGLWHSETVKYGIFQEKITQHDKLIEKVDSDNRDLNFELGKISNMKKDNENDRTSSNKRLPQAR